MREREREESDVSEHEARAPRTSRYLTKSNKRNDNEREKEREERVKCCFDGSWRQDYDGFDDKQGH